MSYGGPSEQFPWVLPEEASRPFIQKALELGINFFDTADVYNAGNPERVLGKARRLGVGVQCVEQAAHLLLRGERVAIH